MRLGPKFVFNDPATAARRRAIELATLKRKIERRFFEKRVCAGRPVEKFIAELDLLLRKFHDVPVPLRQPQQNLNNSKEIQSIVEFPSDLVMSGQSLQINAKKKKNYRRIVKRLKNKLRSHNVILQKTDKSKVFHIGKLDDYEKKSQEYMEKTQAYKYLSDHNPLPDLIQRTNKYLLDLRLAKWITQKQYEMLSINPTEVELAHLYYLPKAHKLGTPLRPIISSLKHPTTKISKYLDDLLRPLFNKMAQQTTVESGFELLKQLHIWSEHNFQKETLFCTIDVTDLYTMIPQVEGVLSLKKMLDYLKLKQVDGLNVETIIRLSRFVMQNNYFSYNNRFYHQIRGGAMGSPLTLTMANCYMFFFEQSIRRQINNSNGLYLRYIDDIFLVINWPKRHLLKEIERWNTFDTNIKLQANADFFTNFLDLSIENEEGQLITKVHHKPSYEPYYLPFSSVHPTHMKKNIPFAMLLRAIRYCSTFQLFLNERESLRMALLLNKYPNQLISSQFSRVLEKFNIQNDLTAENYQQYRLQIIMTPSEDKIKVDYEKNLFVHFTYCSSMRTFPTRFHMLWNKYFSNSPINDLNPILGTRNLNNLQLQFQQT